LVNRKSTVILLVFICVLSLSLCSCGEKKTIENQEKIGGISNTKEIVDNSIILDSKPVNSIIDNAIGKNNGNKPNTSGTIDIDNDSDIPSKTIDNIEISQNSSTIRFYESLIKDDELKDKSYQNISAAIKSRQIKVLIPIMNDTAIISEMYEYVKLDHPEYFYIPIKFKILTTKINNVVSAMELELTYDENTWNPANINKYNTEIESEAKIILSKAKSLDGDYNKVLYIYKYLTQNISYEADSPDDYGIYGALINKKATCEGYSESLQYLLNILKIETITVAGASKGQPHQWNMIKLDDFWYYFDATWDSPINSKKYLPYNYFAITLADLKKTHTLEHESSLPVSRNYKYNYYYYNDLMLYSYDEKSLLDISRRSLSFNPNHISFRIENKDIYNLTINNLQQWVPKILGVMNIKINSISYTLNNELNIIDIYIKEE